MCINSTKYATERATVFKISSDILWLLLRCCCLNGYGKESFLYHTNVTSHLFNYTHSSLNAAAYTLCPQRKTELDMSGYTGECPLTKCLFKVNKNKKPICILIDHTSQATRIHREHKNDTDLHVFM